MILLTGATGSIGSNVTSAMPLQFKLPIKMEHLNQNLNVSEGDSLIHLAGISNPKIVESDADLSYDVNVRSTIALFRAFAAKGGRRFIFASTGHVYGLTSPGSYSSESDALRPQSMYAEQKIETEVLLTKLSQDFETDLLILRIFSVFGPGMRENYLAGMIEKSINANGVLPIISPADDVRDFTTPQMIGHYLNRAVEIDMKKNLTLNLCSGIPRTIKAQVSANYPKIPLSNFVPGNSKIPWLVGNPSLMKEYFVEK